jgi:very-short-patch-repair endonuclease
LRRESSPVEHKLWSLIRGRQLGGYKFRRQHPIDRYFADFACLDAKLAVEIDGAQHEEQHVYDEARTATLEALGWRVMRFSGVEVLMNAAGVADAILAELQAVRA